MSGARIKAYKAGLRAEDLAALLLTFKFYRICARRFKTPFGEIDLIAQRGRTIAFIEVKSRLAHADGLHAVSPRAQKRIIDAARFYTARQPRYADYAMRFDVITVIPWRSVRHLRNAWRAGS